MLTFCIWKYRFARNRILSAFLPFFPMATPLSFGFTEITAIVFPSIRSVMRTSSTLAGLRAFLMNWAGLSECSITSCFFSGHLLQEMDVFPSLANGHADASFLYNKNDSVEVSVNNTVFYGCASYALEQGYEAHLDTCEFNSASHVKPP